MENLKVKIHKIISFLVHRRHFFILIISMISILFIFFNLIRLDLLLGFSENYFLEKVYSIMKISSTIFVILFLPSYPIFFVLFKKLNFNFLEKLSLTIVCNLSFYILIGYFGFLAGFLLTGFFFFFTLLITFFSIIGIIIILDLKNRKQSFLITKKNSEKIQKFKENFSLVKYLKNKISLTHLLLTIFLLLICVFSFIRYDFFYGTDPWYHLYITKLITENHFLAFTEYLGAMGIHIFGATIYFFSNIELILLPRYFVFYTYPLSGLILYNLFMKVFKNKNLAIFGVFFIESTLLGFYEMMLLYWPTSLAVILGLQMFSLLYSRLKNFVKPEKPDKKKILSNFLFTYVLIVFLFLASLVTHSLITTFFLISYFWVFLIYFVKDFRRGFDFLLVCILTGIFLIFYSLNLSVGHINKIISSLMIVPWYYILFTLIFVILGGTFLIRWIKNQIKFAKISLTSFYSGKKRKNHKEAKRKTLLIINLIILTLQTLFFLLGIIFWFNYENLITIAPINIVIIISCSLYGMFYFKKKPKGMILAIWGVSFGILLLIGIISEVSLRRFELMGRIFNLTSIFITLGLLSYIYLAIIKNSIKTVRFKTFILSLVVFSLSFNFSQIFVLNDYLHIDRQEWILMRSYMTYTSDKNVIILEFGWSNVFIFYEFPYEENNHSLIDVNLNIFILATRENIFPENHIDENGTNILKELKEEYNTDVCLIISEFFPLFGSLDMNAYLTKEDYEAYYNLDYLNRIFSSKGEYGNDKPCYWVI